MIRPIICIHENNIVETTHMEIRTMNDNKRITPLTTSVKKDPILKDENEARTEKNTTTM
ncbi:MAG: hypothetical protein JJE53_03715 [Candidatus Pacebacteria bacterium]|nr:hypothetical protein [Candidatus Paceibacterota bacterium]